MALDVSHNFEFDRLLKGGGVQGQKSWKHNFEITSDPKVPPSGSTFWLGFEVPEPYGHRRGHTLFRPQQGHKNRKMQIGPNPMIFHNQSIENSLLRYH